MAKLKQKVISGFIWTVGEKFGSIMVRMLVGWVLMNYLMPEQYAPIIMLGVFLAISKVLTDSGFGQALIQCREATPTDYSSVFYLNIVLSVVLYLVLTILLVVMVWYYDTPLLYKIGPWLFLSGPIDALGFVQIAKLTREMRFDVLSKMHFTANVTSSVIAVTMAITGWGVWALVAQAVSLSIMRTGMAWAMTSWRPAGAFSIESIRKLFRFGSNLLYTGLVSETFGNLSQLVIPKTAGGTQLGLYDKTRKLKDDVAYTITLSLASVTFPAFSSMQNEDEKLKLASRKVIAVISLALFPIMGGLMVTGSEIFHIFIDESKGWWDGIGYFQLFCISALFMPLTHIMLNILKAKGSSRTIFKLEVIKKTFAVAVLAFTAPISVQAIVYGYLAWMAFEMMVNVIAAKRLVNYRWTEILTDTLPYLGITVIMVVSVGGIGCIIPGMTLGITLGAKIVTGIIVYVLLNLIFCLPAWRDAVEISRTLLKREK